MKKTLLVIAVLVLLGIVTLAVVPFLIDPNDYKDQIVAQIEKQTGRSFVLEGDIRMSKFPVLGIEVGKLALGNADGFGERPMLSSSSASVSVKVIPLLRKDVQISTLKLRDVSIHLARNAQGKTNWDDFVASKSTERATVDTQEPSDRMALAALTVGGIDLQNGEIIWDDRLNQQRYSVRQLNLKTGALQYSKPIELDLDLMFEASKEKISGSLSLEGEIEYELEQEAYAAKDLKLQADLISDGVPGQNAKVELRSTLIRADLKQGTASAKNLYMEALGSRVEGDIEARQILEKIPLASGKFKLNIESVGRILQAVGQDPNMLPLKSAQLNARFESTQQSMTFSQLDGELQVLAPEASKPEMLKFDLQGSIDTKSQKIDLSRLSLHGLDATVKGQLSIRNYSAQIPMLDGDFQLQAGDIGKLLSFAGVETMPVKSMQLDTKLRSTSDTIHIDQLTAKASSDYGNVKDISLTAKGSVNPGAEALVLESFRLQSSDLDMRGAVRGTKIFKSPAFSGDLSIAALNLREWLSGMKVDLHAMADTKTLTQVDLNTRFTAATDSVSLKALELKLDETQIKGDFEIANFTKPATRFNLQVNEINVDRYLPPKPKEDSDKKKTDTATPVELPMEVLRSLNASGKLEVGRLVIADTHIEKLNLQLQANNGLIVLEPLRANLYQGQYAGSVRVDATGKQAIVQINTDMQGVQIGNLLDDLTGNKKIEGLATTKFQLKGSGSNVHQIKQSLSGDASMEFINGALLGVNLAKIIRQAQARLGGQSLSEVSAIEKTDFSEMTASMKINNGVVRNEDFQLKSPLLRVTGKGDVNIASEEVDYRINTILVKSIKGQGGEGLDELTGIPIPVRISGTFSKLKYAPDLESALKTKAAQQLEKNKEKIIEKVLPDKLKGIGGLLGGKPAEDSAQTPAENPNTVPKSEAVEDAAKEPESPSPAATEEKPKSKEEELKDALKSILKF